MANRRLGLFLAALTALLLVSVYAFVRSGSGASGGARASDLISIPTDARVDGTLGGNPIFSGGPEDELPPESTLSCRGSTLSSEGENTGLPRAARPTLALPLLGGAKSNRRAPNAHGRQAPQDPEERGPELPLRRLDGVGRHLRCLGLPPEQRRASTRAGY